MLDDVLRSLRECPFLLNGTVHELGTFSVNTIVL